MGEKERDADGNLHLDLTIQPDYKFNGSINVVVREAGKLVSDEISYTLLSEHPSDKTFLVRDRVYD